jgi:hypothetical protein
MPNAPSLSTLLGPGFLRHPMLHKPMGLSIKSPNRKRVPPRGSAKHAHARASRRLRHGVPSGQPAYSRPPARLDSTDTGGLFPATSAGSQAFAPATLCGSHTQTAARGLHCPDASRARNDARQRKACRGAIAPPLPGVSHGDSSARLAPPRCLRARNDTRQRKACRGAIAPPLPGVSHGDSSARLAPPRCLRARNDTRQRKACRGAIAPPLLGVSHGDSSARLASSRCLRAREHAAGRRPASIGTCASRRLSPSWANRDRQRVRRRRATHRRSRHRRGNHGRRLAARRWRPIASSGHECRLVALAPAASLFPATGQAREH